MRLGFYQRSLTSKTHIAFALVVALSCVILLAGTQTLTLLDIGVLSVGMILRGCLMRQRRF